MKITKLKDFDYQKACGGHPVVYRDMSGNIFNARLICSDLKGDYPLVYAVVYSSTEERPVLCNRVGGNDGLGCFKMLTTLRLEYINIYRHKNGTYGLGCGVFDTPQDAEKAISQWQPELSFVKTVLVREWEE
jgi:hypothetical protein